MKKIIASKSALFICLFADLLFSIALIVGLIFLSDAIITGEGSQIVTWSMLSGGLALFLVPFLFGTNRFGCIVTIDSDRIKRNGFFFGFKKECKTQDIQKVLVVDVDRFGKMIVLVDGNSPHGFDYIRKKSCICFEYNDKNMAVLKSFRQGDIEFS